MFVTFHTSERPTPNSSEFGVAFTHIPPKHLYGMITNIHHTIKDLRTEIDVSLRCSTPSVK